MGASKYKKLRSEEKIDGLSAKERQQNEALAKSKKEKKLYTIIGILVAVFILAVVVLSSPLMTRGLPAAKVGSTSYSLADVRYASSSAYQSFSNNFGDYISYILDPSVPLDEQECAYDPSMTWQEYFNQAGLDSLVYTTVMENAAKEAGYTLSEGGQAEIDSTISMMELYGQMYGYSGDGFIALNYGEGNNEKTLRSMLEKVFLCDEYAQTKQKSFTYTDDQLDSYYAENANSFNTVSTLYYSIPAVEDTEAGLDAEAAMAQAAETKDAILAAYEEGGKTAEAFSDAVLSVTGEEATESNLTVSGTADAEWFASADRTEGEVFVSEEETAIRLYCYLTLEDNQYNTVSVRHILIQCQDADGDGEYSDDEKKAAEDALNEVIAQWDGSEENFIELANQYSEDSGSNTNGGLYEKISKGSMVDEFDAFCFSGAKPGDTKVVYGSNGGYAGYHFIYFVGEGSLYSRVLADNDMRSQDYSDWYNEISEGYEATTTFLYRYA